MKSKLTVKEKEGVKLLKKLVMSEIKNLIGVYMYEGKIYEIKKGVVYEKSKGKRVRREG